MIGTPITINGKEYLVRFPIGALILMEKDLGWSIMDIGRHTLTIADMSVIVRYGLHNEKGLISKEEYQGILDSTSIEDFTQIFTTVSESFVSKVDKSAEREAGAVEEAEADNVKN